MPDICGISGIDIFLKKNYDELPRNGTRTRSGLFESISLVFFSFLKFNTFFFLQNCSFQTVSLYPYHPTK